MKTYIYNIHINNVLTLRMYIILSLVVMCSYCFRSVNQPQLRGPLGGADRRVRWDGPHATATSSSITSYAPVLGRVCLFVWDGAETG
jgi:hypothetical protein